MEKKQKNMMGKKVIGYICKKQEENITESEPVYIIASDTLDLNTNETSKIYEVEGISKVQNILFGEQKYYGRAYYTCDNIQIKEELKIEEIVKMCLYTQNSIYRVIAFYPLTEVQAVAIAKIFKDEYYVIKALTTKYPNNTEIRTLLDIASMKHNQQKIKEKKEKILKKIYGK